MDGSYSSLVAPTLLKKNDIVLVVGAGPIGLTAIGMAALEAGKVIAVDFYKNRLEMAKEFGAAFVYNRSEMSVTDILQAIKSDVGEVDVTYMCIALDQSKELDAFHLAVEATRIDGRIAGVNVEVKPQRHNHYLNPFHMNKKNIKYRHYLERGRDTSDFQKGFNQVGKGLFPIKKMITHHVTLDKLAWALDMTHNHLGECIKIIVYPRME